MANMVDLRGTKIETAELAGMSLSDWYLTKQVQAVVGFFIPMDYRMQINRWRDRANIYYRKFCGVRIYHRESVNKWLRTHQELSFEERRKLEDRIFEQVRYQIDLNAWRAYCYLEGEWPYTHRALMGITINTGFNSIRYKYVEESNLYFYNLADIRRWIRVGNLPEEEK